MVKVIPPQKPWVHHFLEWRMGEMAKGAEANVLAELTMDKQYQIKPNFSAIAEKRGMDRHTVKKYWEQGGKIDRERSPKTSKYAPYRKEIDDVMGKPGVTVRSAWEFLKDVHPGIGGAYFGFRDYVRSIGWLPRGKQQPHPRFETELGERLQVYA
jgi:transposase